MTSPLVSVIIPCYNAVKYIEKSVESIITQSYKNLEILIIDDCSNDGSYQILEKLQKQDNRIKLYRNENNLKIVATLNKLVLLSSGKYIARMDADDISLNTRIEKQVDFLEKNPDYGLCGTSIYRVDEDGKKIGATKFPIKAEDNRFFIRFFPTLCHPTVMARADILKNNLYAEEFNYAEDYELWTRLISKRGINIGNLSEKLFKYRIFSNQVSQSHKEEQCEKSVRIIKEYDLVEPQYEKSHIKLFFLQNNLIDEYDIQYLSFIYKCLKSRELELSRQIAARMISILLKAKENSLLIKFTIFNPINILALFIGLKNKLMYHLMK